MSFKVLRVCLVERFFLLEDIEVYMEVSCLFFFKSFSIGVDGEKRIRVSLVLLFF